MKRVVLFILSLTVSTCAALAGPEIIKQRAKELRDQNNARQGVPPPAPAQPAPSSTPKSAPTLSPAQQNLARLQADLAAITAKPQVSPEQKQQLAKDLMTVAQGNKPSREAVAKLANDLTQTLVGKNVGATERTRLVQDINAVLNSAIRSQSQIQAIATDAQAMLQVSGVQRRDAVNVVNDLNTVALEVQKGQ